jgi:hypothetical protein
MKRTVFLVLIGVAMSSGCHSSEGSKPEPARSIEQPAATAMSDATASASTTAPATGPAQVFGLGPGWELAPSAQYTASQTPGEVIIKASGSNPTAGYEMKLVQSPLRIWPPQWMLAQKKPSGIVAQVIRPFEVSASFKSTDPVKTIVIGDASGRHEVNVDQARD